jgi:purine-binding chemotaxis protein CheW
VSPKPPSRGKPRLELPHSGLARDVLPALRDGAEAANAPAPAAAAVAEPGEPAPREDARLRGPERIFAFADRVQAGERREAVEVETPTRWVTFTLERETFGLPLTHVREIMRVSPITRVPYAPFPLRGVTNLRGTVLPVVDLRIRLQLPVAEIDADSRILVLEARGRLIGLLVDAVQQILPLLPSRIEPPPEDVMTSQSYYLSGVYQLGADLLILLDADRVLLIHESPPVAQAAPGGPAVRRKGKAE